MRSALDGLVAAGMSRREAHELEQVWQAEIARQFKALRDHLAPMTGLADHLRLLSVQAEDAARDDLVEVLAASRDRRRGTRGDRTFQVWLVVAGVVLTAIAAVVLRLVHL